MEDLFLYEGPKCSPNFGRDGWPYLQCEILNLRERQHLQDQTHVFAILKDLPALSRRLDLATWEHDRNDNLQVDVEWRADRFERRHGFWDHARADLPWQLTEGIRSDSEFLNVQHAPEFDSQMLSRHGFFSKAILVRDSFKCIHRGDGMMPIDGSICYR